MAQNPENTPSVFPADECYAADEKINEILDQSAKATLLRFSTAGSVDDGKSTLIGRLLHDSKNVFDDHLQSLEKASTKAGKQGGLELELLTDGLRAEREQGITIDVAYRYFSTPKRHFILADAPGHEQYTRNMATGASTANAALLLIDARHGVVTQTKRHAFILSLLGVPRFLVAVNKMDLVDYKEEVFEQIRSDFTAFAAKLDVKELRFVPISAKEGDNVVHTSKHMAWFQGETVMDYLERVYTGSDTNLIDFRFPVQYVVRPNQNYRGYAGQVISGTIRVGEEIIVLPSRKRSRIQSIDTFGKDGHTDSHKEAFAPMSITITLEDQIDIARGDMIARIENVPLVQDRIEAMVVWMGEEQFQPQRPYILKHTTRETKAIVDQIKYRVDVNTLHRIDPAPLSLNEIGRVSFRLAQPLFLDTYKRNRSNGSFILIDPDSLQTVAAGMIIDRRPQQGRTASADQDPETVTSANIHQEAGFITKGARESRYGFKATTLWFTGLSSSGKSSIAKALEQKLFEERRPVYRLDGDNLRFGLNRDLGFSASDRAENIRRVAEVARLFNQAGITVICSFISPFKKDRELAKDIIGADSYCEVFVDTPLEVCESRDPHGLYKKARLGEIREFTGISSPYEEPETPDIVIKAAEVSIEECAALVYQILPQKLDNS
jgi:bifunctional enzyme CysN/CysC